MSDPVEPKVRELKMWLAVRTDLPVSVGKLLGPGSAIAVNTVGGNVVLTGNNLSQADVAHIDAIRKIYPQVLDFTSANAVENGQDPFAIVMTQALVAAIGIWTGRIKLRG